MVVWSHSLAYRIKHNYIEKNVIDHQRPKFIFSQNSYAIIIRYLNHSWHRTFEIVASGHVPFYNVFYIQKRQKLLPSPLTYKIQRSIFLCELSPAYGIVVEIRTSTRVLVTFFIILCCVCLSCVQQNKMLRCITKRAGELKGIFSILLESLHLNIHKINLKWNS